jgi:hypothetical protein
VLVRDPQQRVEPQALLSTDLKLSARQIVGYFVRRWSMETTFQEARLYLGLEGQRQWNDLATARATPVRLALFSFIALYQSNAYSGTTFLKNVLRWATFTHGKTSGHVGPARPSGGGAHATEM